MSTFRLNELLPGFPEELIDALAAELEENDLLITGGGGGVQEFSMSFVNADLVAGVLSVNHALNSQLVGVTVMRDTLKQVHPDDVTFVDANNLELDLTLFGAIPGTWVVRVQGGA
jgi:hypothetical protein